MQKDILNNKVDVLQYAKSGKFVIYGAGQFGITCLRFLQQNGLIDNVECFAVSEQNELEEEIMGLPVFGVAELQTNSRVLIATHSKLHIEITNTLAEHNITDIAGISRDCYLQIRRTIPDFYTEQFLETKRSSSLGDEIKKIKNFLMLKEIAPNLIKDTFLIDDENVITKYCLPEFLFDMKKDSTAALHAVLFLSHKMGSIKPEIAWDLHIKTIKNNREVPFYLNSTLQSIFSIIDVCREDEEKELFLKDIYNSLKVNINPNNISRYIRYLVQINKQEDALKILYDAKNILTIENIYPYYEVSYLASSEKVFDHELINLSAKLYTIFSRNEKNKVFEKYLENKTVAIVGNGPYEIGTNNGKIIDSYDVVIRFNYFYKGQHCNDYGNKVNIHSIYSGFDVGYINDCALYFLINCYPLNLSYLNSLKKIDIDKLIRIPNFVNRDIYNKYSMSWTTSGLKMVYYVKKILKEKFKKENVFGMALKNGYVSDIIDYFSKEDRYNLNYDNYRAHNFHLELKVLLELFSNEKDK